MGKKLKIAVWHNLPTGGARRALFDHVRGLVSRGHEMHIWRPPVPSPDWLDMSSLAKETVVPLEFGEEGSGYFGKLLRHFQRQTVLVNAMTKHSEECARQINAGGFDLLFANTCRHFYSPFIGRFVSGIPKVLYLQEPNRTLYEAMPDLAWLGQPAGSWKRKLRAKLDVPGYRRMARIELTNAKSYDRVLVNSHFSRESVLKAYGLDSRVCYLGVDTDHFQPAPCSKRRFVLGVGAIAPTKNVLEVVRAVSRLNAGGVPLIWAGNFSDPAYAERVKKLVAELEVDFEARVLVTDQELLSLYQSAACVVFIPSLEPFGYVPLEAMACGTPVVGIREGGLRETIVHGETGFLTDGDLESVTTYVDSLLSNPESAQRLGDQGRKWVEERWSLGGAIDRLESNLLEITGK